MKMIIFTALILSSFVRAGDLSTVCYLNDDAGDFLNYVGPINSYEKMGMNFSHDNKSYTVLTTLNSTFNYNVEVIAIDNLTGEYSRNQFENVDYAQELNVSSEVTCMILD